MPRKVSSIRITPTARFETGCIATFSDGTVHHFAGNGREATRAVAEWCDLHSTCVVTLSTPETIYRDLQGTRAEMETHDSPTPSRSGYGQPNDIVRVPEPQMLGAIGRMDLRA